MSDPAKASTAGQPLDPVQSIVIVGGGAHELDVAVTVLPLD